MIISAKAKLAAVLGYPVSHSLSPKLHGYWLDKYKIDGTYIALPVPKENLKSTIRMLHATGFRGCNLTIPHKESVFGIAYKWDEVSAKIGAVNTIVFEEGTVKAYNTDVEGFIENLKYNVPDYGHLKNVVLLGAGGAARAVTYALSHLGFANLKVINRDISKAGNLKPLFKGDFEHVSWENRQQAIEGCDFLINSTSLGMKGHDPLSIDLSVMNKHGLVYDLIYNPLKTPLLAQAETLGIETINGLGMLIFQGVRGFQMWYGIKPEVDEEVFRFLEKNLV